MISDLKIREYVENHFESEVAKANATIGIMWANNEIGNELAALRAENAKLREALETLYDEQNGCPLATREKQWESAMKKAQEALFSTTPDPLYIAAPEMLEAIKRLVASVEINGEGELNVYGSAWRDLKRLANI